MAINTVVINATIVINTTIVIDKPIMINTAIVIDITKSWASFSTLSWHGKMLYMCFLWLNTLGVLFLSQGVF